MVTEQILGATPEAAMRRMIDRAAGSVTGCCGATSTTFTGRDRASDISSHPDLSLLLRHADPVASPMITAADTGQPTAVRDTLTDQRWPAFSLAALRVGVRSFTCGVVGVGERAITCTLYSLVPDGLPVESAAIATALIRESVRSAAQAGDFERARREVRHLTQAIAARGMIEQAKGMIMQAMNCDADTAFEHLARASRRDHLRIADVARRLVDNHPAGVAALRAGGPRPGQARA